VAILLSGAAVGAEPSGAPGADGAALERDDPAQAEHSVAITAAGPPEPVALVEARTRALLRDVPVTISWSVRASFRPRDVFESKDGPELSRIWLDLRDSARAVLYVVDVAHERFLVRVVPLESGYDEVAGESLGTILESSVEALLAGATLGVTREAAEEQVSALGAPESAPQRAPASEPAPAVDSAPVRSRRAVPYQIAPQMDLRLQALSEGPVLLYGPEFGASLLRPGRHLSVAAFLDLGYRSPVDWQVDGVGARFRGLGVRGGAGVRFGLGARGSLAVLGTVGVDGLEVSPVVGDPAAEARDTFWIAMPMAGLHLDGEVEVAPDMWLWCSLGAEVDLMGHHFDMIEAGEPVTVLAPWRVQPVLRIGLRLGR